MCAYFVNLSKLDCSVAQVTMYDINPEDQMILRLQAQLEIDVEMTADKSNYDGQEYSDVQVLCNMAEFIRF